MSRCQHCNKLTHPEDLRVYYDKVDFEKVWELQTLENWTAKWAYDDVENTDPLEYGKLKCGDIIIHFISKSEGKCLE